MSGKNKMFKNILGKNVSDELINIEGLVLKDFLQSFINTESINTEKQRNSDLPKFQYTHTKGDNFNSRLIGGCSSCGTPFDLMLLLDSLNNETYPKTTQTPRNYSFCKICSSKILKLHNMNLSDSIVHPITKDFILSSSFYFAGIRSSLHFGSSNRRWIKYANYKNVNKRKSALNNVNTSNNALRVLDAMQKKKAPKIQEICPECSHNEAFFTQFQARSADEGTTVMYECCKCLHRRVVNN